jgi:2Fe-2S ferredoxin
MVRIVFVVDGAEHVVEANGEANLMKLAVRNDIPGIEGECGGCAVCGTCHIVVAPSDAGRLPPAKGAELDLLSAFDDITATSRLACCIEVSEAVDGLRAEVWPLL